MALDFPHRGCFIKKAHSAYVDQTVVFADPCSACSSLFLHPILVCLDQTHGLRPTKLRNISVLICFVKGSASCSHLGSQRSRRILHHEEVESHLLFTCHGTSLIYKCGHSIFYPLTTAASSQGAAPMSSRIKLRRGRCHSNVGRETFRGGRCHCNRRFALRGERCHSKVEEARRRCTPVVPHPACCIGMAPLPWNGACPL